MLNLRLLVGVAVLVLLTTIAPTQLTVEAVPLKRTAARAVASPRLSHRLRAALTESDAADVLVFVEGRADLTPALALDDKAMKGTFVVDALRATAERSQRELRLWLDARGVVYQSYWVVNMLRVRAGREIVAELAARSDVRRLDLNARITTLDPQQGSHELLALPNLVQEVPWGIARVGAPAVWDLGIRGQGIVVAGNDTGVDWDHEALKDSYRGWNGEAADHAYNWHDAWDKTPRYPSDDSWHGTHTIATAAGGGPYQVGVAPDAEWIACRNMDNETGTPESYIDCFQFFLAPTNLDGRDARPELAPHIVNNSWHCPPNEGCFLSDPLWQDTIRPAAEALVAAGIAVVASTGNSGYQGCGSVTTLPGAYALAISTGAIAPSGRIATFSSRGPATMGGRTIPKPDLAAPGTSVLSAAPGDEYRSSDGTSMASPHVAGTIALLWSAEPELVGRVAVTEQLLRASAQPANDLTCGGDPDGQPNNVYGWGVLDAAGAVDALEALSHLSGTVSDDDSVPVAGASVRIADLAWGVGIELLTDAAGEYSTPLLPGSYRIVVDKPGYVPVVSVVTIQEDATATRHVILPRLAASAYFPLVRIDSPATATMD
jgi:serine protease AprX